MATRKRTTLYSSAGKKLYAVRNADGTFNDIQTYQRAHSADMARKSSAENAVAAARGVVKKAAAKKAPAKKVAAKKAPARKAAAKKTATKKASAKKAPARKAAKK